VMASTTQPVKAKPVPPATHKGLVNATLFNARVKIHSVMIKVTAKMKGITE